MEFKDKVVIITGGGSGIGRGAAELFSKKGAKVVITDINLDGMKETASKCIGEVIKIIADVKSEEDCAKIINETIKKFGRIDVLVNNAGVGAPAGYVTNTSMEDFDNVMNVNVRGVFYLTKIAIPHLIETQGNIVNVSSISGLRPYSGITTYCMSKAALDQFTRCLSLEFASSKVRVNSVNPGVILTNFHKGMGIKTQDYEDYLEQIKISYPIGRLATIEDITHAIAFVASSEASFITGTILPIDGGRTNASK